MDFISIEGKIKGVMSLGSEDDRLDNLYERIHLARIGVNTLLKTYDDWKTGAIFAFDDDKKEIVQPEYVEIGLKEELMRRLNKELVNSIVMIHYTIENNSDPFVKEGWERADYIKKGIQNTYFNSLFEIMKEITLENCMGRVYDFREIIDETVSNLPRYFEKWDFYNTAFNNNHLAFLHLPSKNL